MLSVLPYLLIIFAAFAGVMLASYIYHKKRTKEVLVCPLKADCQSVVTSEYARFFGIPVELLGIGYYSLLAVSYAIIAAVPAVAAPPLVFGLLVITSAAFLFSLYLTFIQAFAIKQWCSWCLVSAGLCTIIFFLVASNSTLGLLPLLASHREVLLAIHLLGLALGLGGATTTDILFFRFLRDWRISAHEADIMRVLSQLIWFGLAVLVMSGLGLYLPQAAVLNESAKFLVKMVVVSVIIVNGAFLNLVVSPRLVTISFGQDQAPNAAGLKRWRRLAFALGAVSATSWYSAFILGLLRTSPWPFWGLLLIYLALLGGAVIGGQVLERRMARSAALPSNVIY
ncbi:MAG: vitamin K epoxide reductase family protein [Candidatus Andersenbacteria bacterium]|nr:vitamin K epoxide reductase family protein [Candidatus Andersenbacteria bacterium]